MYSRVYKGISRNVKVPFKLLGGDKIVDTPVHRALCEVLANCLVNTDYFVPRGIVIKRENDQILIENPGITRVGEKSNEAQG